MRIFKGLLLVTMFVVAVAYWWNSRPRQEIDLSGASQPEAGEMAPVEPKDFTAIDAKGRSVKLSSLRGKPILLNFWASWCPPCLTELPSLLKFANAMKREAGLEVVAVSVDKEWTPVTKLFAEKKLWPQTELPLTILLNADGSIATSYGTTKFPETYFIDKGFKMIRKFTGAQDWTSQETIQWIMEHSK